MAFGKTDLLGLISNRQASRKGLSLKGTRVQASKMADFDDQGGDEGVGDDRGVSAAGNRSIDRNQDMGSPARASGKPSKGGSVNAASQPVKRGQIDDGAAQLPAFPAGSSAKKGRPGWGTPKSKGKIAPQGGQYGGGGRSTQ